MKTVIRLSIFTVAILATFRILLWSGAGTTSMNFLKLPHGNRAVAMGSSFVSIANGPCSIYWNPAGLASGVFNQVSLEVNRWIQSIYHGHAAYRHKLACGGLGGAVTYLNSGPITQRTRGREDSGETYQLQNLGLDIGGGIKVCDSFDLGLGIKFINESIGSRSSTALAFSAGGLYHRKAGAHFFSAGLSAMNMGAKAGYSRKFPLPGVIRLGVADELPGGRLTGAVESDYYFIEKKVNLGTGIEFKAAPFLDLRLGYRFGLEDDAAFPEGLTAGVGIKYIEEMEYLFDISICALGDLGTVISMGTGFKF